jgi:hypothetical protein
VPVGEVGASSFDAYEGIRIVIPGAIFVGAAAFVVDVTGHGRPAPFDDPGSVVLLALISGLVLYFLDLPAKTAVYRSKDQPTDYLEREFGSQPGMRPGVILNRYFILLNTVMPTTLRNRALYMGSMYRIGVEAIFALVAASSVLALLFRPRATTRSAPNQATFVVVGLLALVVLLIAGFAAAVRYEAKRGRRNAESPDSRAVVAGRVWRSLVNRWLMPYAVLLLVQRFLQLGSSAFIGWAGGATMLAATGYAYVFYVTGTASERGSRTPTDSLAAALVLAAPQVIVLCDLLNRGSSAVSVGQLYAWWAATMLAVLLVMTRGHERKLTGAYASQVSWFRFVRADLARYFVLEAPAGFLYPDAPAALTETSAAAAVRGDDSTDEESEDDHTSESSDAT